MYLIAKYVLVLDILVFFQKNVSNLFQQEQPPFFFLSSFLNALSLTLSLLYLDLFLDYLAWIPLTMVLNTSEIFFPVFADTSK